MTRDDIIRMAKEATNKNVLFEFSPQDIRLFERFAELVAAALAQPEPKPMAWGVQEGINLHDVFLFKDEAEEMCHLKGDHAKAIPLYTAPPQREWVGLTDEDIDAAWKDKLSFSRAIEAKLKEKNSG